MTNILNQVAKSHHDRFRPSSPDEYLALRLAYLLGEPEAAVHYSTLASQYSQSKLLSAYRYATKTTQGERPSQRFHKYLAANGSHRGIDTATRSRLLAVKIERRTVAVAMFLGLHLEGRRILQLSSDPRRAEASATAFVRGVLSENDYPSVAVETVSRDVKRTILHAAVLAQCRDLGISVQEIAGQTILKTAAYPPLRSREELRALMLQMWPVQGLTKAQWGALDAFALGLYVQTERLLSADH